MSDGKKKNPYDCSGGERIKEIIAALRKRLPRGMNPWTGEPGGKR